MARPVIAGNINHTGSTLQGPVNSTIDKRTPDFVKIEGKPILLQGDLIDTGSHWYANSAGPPVSKLYHSHSNQSIDDPNTWSGYWKIEGNETVLLVGSLSTAEDTHVDGESQNFVNI